jgi:DNA-binding SARP family transcriptional activator/tetratricopeptide (TPR) repeat protein
MSGGDGYTNDRTPAPAAMNRLELRLLGGFHVRVGCGPPLALPAKAQALLAYLALRPGAGHPREKIAALLWGAASDAQARANLRHTVFTLRKALDETVLQTAGHSLSVESNAVDVDAGMFEELVADGTPGALERAGELYRGDLLEGLVLAEPAFEEWLLAERERLRELAVDALTKLLAHQMREPATQRAIQTAMRLLAFEPLQEAVHRTLMRLYAREDRRAAALKQYQICVAVLQRELGAEPEPETRSLYQKLLQRPERAPNVSRVGRPSDQSNADRAAEKFAQPLIAAAEPPLIGRENELDSLRTALSDTARGAGRVVAILGEAGVGKTRLLAAFTDASQISGARALTARSYESEHVFAFAPWVDALRAGGVVADDTLLTSLGPARRAVLARLFPEMEETQSAGGAHAGVLALFEAMLEVFARLAVQASVVVVVEDLQWADEMSLRLLAFLGRRLGAHRILIVVSAREEDVADVPLLRDTLNELEHERRLIRVAVAPLSRSETESLARALARTGSPESILTQLGARVWELSGGNPFVAVEAVRALGDVGSIPLPAALPLPERVRQVIGRRLDSLQQGSLTLATVATVIGREFEFAVAQRASGLEPEHAAAAVEELVRRRLLHGVGDRFDFTHDRIREAIRERLIAPRRQVLHAAVGRALESVYAHRLADVVDQLAYHYAQTPDDSKAVEYLVGFSDHAFRTYGVSNAVSTLEEARRRAERLPAADHDRWRTEIVLRLAHIHYFQGAPRTSLKLLDEVREPIERLGDPRKSGPYYFLTARAWTLIGEHPRALDAARRALDEAERCSDDATAGKAQFVLGHETYLSTSLREAAELGARAIARLERTDETWWLGMSHWLVAASRTLMAEVNAARTAATQVLEIGETLGDPRLACYGLWTLGWIAAARGDGEPAVAFCERALARAPDPTDRLNATAALGYVLLERGEVAAAIPRLEEAVALLRGWDVPRPQGLFLAMLADAYRAAGRLDAARKTVEEALRIGLAFEYPYAKGWAERTLGRMAEVDGSVGDARDRLAAALATFGSIEARLEVGRTHLDLARVERAAGNGDAAGRHLGEARALFSALDLGPWLERAQQVAFP